jgi:hypothetical protein
MNVTINDGTGGTTTQQTTTTTTSTTTNSGGMSSTTTSGGSNGGNVNISMSGTGMDGGMNTSTTVTGTGMSSGTTTTGTTTTGTTTNYDNGSNSSNGGCGWAMSSADFEDAKKSIANQSFADKKLTVSKQVVDNNCLTTDQVKQLMKLFDFESNKLDFAKYAYKKTLDRNNYYKVNDAFDFSGSVDELDKYIKTVK